MALRGGKLSSMKKEIIVQPEIKFLAVDYEVTSVTDNPIEKTVTAKLNLISDDKQKYDYAPIIVWTDDAYDAAGQWTDDDLKKRIEEILNE